MTSPALSPEQASGFIESVIDPAGWALKQLKQLVGVSHVFQPNECSRYHSAISFKGNRCPACKALAEREVLEDRLDDCRDRLENAIDAKFYADERLSEISRRRL